MGAVPRKGPSIPVRRGYMYACVLHLYRAGRLKYRGGAWPLQETLSFEASVHKSILLLLPSHLHCPHCCNAIARLLRNIPPPPLYVRRETGHTHKHTTRTTQHTTRQEQHHNNTTHDTTRTKPQTIHHTILVIAISCKVVPARRSL